MHAREAMNHRTVAYDLENARIRVTTYMAAMRMSAITARIRFMDFMENAPFGSFDICYYT